MNALDETNADEAHDLGERLANGPIRRRSLHEQVTDRVRDMIIEGELAPGDRINEVDLVERLGVSRTPLREALRTLAAESLIDTLPSRGSVVRRLTPEDVFAMLQVLAELEALAGRLVCATAADEQIEGILRLHERMMDRYEAGDRLAYYKANQAIHGAIAAASGNGCLAETQASIQARLKRIRFIGNHSPEKWAGAVAEHRRMAAALEARDGDALASVLREHLVKTWDRVRSVV